MENIKINKEQKIKPSNSCYNCIHCNYINGDIAQCMLSPEEPIDIYVFETCNYFKINKSFIK